MTPLILAAVLSASNPDVLTLPAPPPTCKPDRATQTLLRERSQARRLGDMPQGRRMRTVLREAGGCAYVEVRSPDGWRIEPAGVAARKVEPAR